MIELGELLNQDRASLERQGETPLDSPLAARLGEETQEERMPVSYAMMGLRGIQYYIGRVRSAGSVRGSLRHEL